MICLLLWALGLLAAPAAPLCASGKVIVTTASELADAIRTQESVISIDARITGTANEQLARNSGVYALERYDDFPEVLSAAQLGTRARVPANTE